MNAQQAARAIDEGVRALGQQLPPGASAKMASLLMELRRWNERFNLTSIDSAEAMVAGHVLDSLAVRPFLNGTSLLDIGTGAGFPGLPLALAEPSLRVELLDSNGKKIAFVRHLIARLEVGNAAAVKARVEHYAPGTGFDTVVARAFAAIPEMVKLAAPLVGAGGVLLALKGKYPQEELRQLSSMNDLSNLWDYNVTEITVPGLDSHARHIVSLRRRGTGL
ncbi:MAG: 16S rRNA (guanine(527)-N(7))-methyltransferase RsmG [Woeseia sp.]